MKKSLICICLIVLMLVLVSCKVNSDQEHIDNPPVVIPDPDIKDPNDADPDINNPIDPDPKDPIEVNKRFVVYINIDGFAKYYYDEALVKGLVPNLSAYINDGIFFDKLYNLLPSITNPVQNMIISGADSSATHNVYRYFDRTNHIVVQQQRQNDAETIYDVVKKEKITSATIRHFLAEEIFSPTNPNHLYIREPHGTVSDAIVRFDQAVKLVSGESFMNGSVSMKVDDIPQFLSIYVDDLDALGHNESSYYGYTKAKTETERMSNVLHRLNIIDSKIKELVDVYKAKGIYNDTVFLITTDHGMTPFGANSDGITSLTNKYSKTKWPALKDKLKAIDSNLIFEYLGPGEKPKESTTLVGFGAGLNMPISFMNPRVPIIELENIALELEKEVYIEKVFTRNELIQMGFWRNANVDLLVIPSEAYHFHGRSNVNGIYAVRGQHDSYLDSSRNIFGLVFGGQVKKIGILNEETYVHSFGVMIADALNVILPHANALKVDFLIEDETS
ncbi:alkaline phosphatase family protein [Acholeplasma granularum]|uniref:alkaline phosphatase family protein n=1 Tax=Acholeplasma granularum TaxID=264635 RepID=UPI00138B0C0D|nr:alkaline phosphatase family protein [Acholeplasma granularum]